MTPIYKLYYISYDHCKIITFRKVRTFARHGFILYCTSDTDIVAVAQVNSTPPSLFSDRYSVRSADVPIYYYIVIFDNKIIFRPNTNAREIKPTPLNMIKRTSTGKEGGGYKYGWVCVQVHAHAYTDNHPSVQGVSICGKGATMTCRRAIRKSEQQQQKQQQ